MPNAPTLYDLLEVSPQASSPVIRAAYRCLAQLAHPDKHRGDGLASERQTKINGAYAVLSDPARRQRYDQVLALRTAFVERRRCEAAPLGGTSVGTHQSQDMRAYAFRPLV